MDPERVDRGSLEPIHTCYIEEIGKRLIAQTRETRLARRENVITRRLASPAALCVCMRSMRYCASEFDENERCGLWMCCSHPLDELLCNFRVLNLLLLSFG